MAEATWRYRVGEQELGPVTGEELRQMFAGGTLPLQTSVWCSAINKWVLADTIPAFRQAVPVPVQPVEQAQTLEEVSSPDQPAVALDYANLSGEYAYQPHPWVRFFARGCDNLMLSMTLMTVVVLAFRGRQPLPPIGLGFVTAFVLVFIESFFLCMYGTTPGKVLLGVRVETASGGKPTYSQALSRSFLVWIVGQGLGFPIVSLITTIVAYSKLTSEGQTSWDRSTALRVRHAPCGAGRVIGGIALTSVYCAVLLVAIATIAAVLQLHARATLAGARPIVPAVVPPPSYSANAPAFAAPADPRQLQLAGTWVISATQRTPRGSVRWTNTLWLERNGTFRQSIRASDSVNGPRPDLSQDWSGTWTLFGSDFIQMVDKTSALQHPMGRWVYSVTDSTPDQLTMKRQSSPLGLASSDSHPVYNFRRSAMTLSGE